MTLLLDTGAVYAYYDREDRWHEAMRVEIDAEPDTLMLPAVVVPEVDHLLGARIGRAARLALYEDMAQGVYLLADLEPARFEQVRDLNHRYADLELGFVDAAVAALSQQLGVRRLATTDRRHFTVLAQDFDLALVPLQPPP